MTATRRTGIPRRRPAKETPRGQDGAALPREPREQPSSTADAPAEAAPPSRTRAVVRTPEDTLREAMMTGSPFARARLARRGLASRGPLDRTTQAMLLRQLYLSYYERRDFTQARAIALQALELGVLLDAFHQDAARAALAEHDVPAAIAHLRVAARRGPPSRRAFHLWTLGSVLFLSHRYAEAAGALERAARWGKGDKPLYRAHLALVRIAAGERVEDLQGTIDDLAAAPCGRGYGRFVLGHLAYAAGDRDAARRFLEAFLRRAEAPGRVALQTSLALELTMTRATLAKMAPN